MTSKQDHYLFFHLMAKKSGRVPVTYTGSAAAEQGGSLEPCAREISEAKCTARRHCMRKTVTRHDRLVGVLLADADRSRVSQPVSRVEQ